MNQPNKCRVYVGNLSWKVRWQDLKDHMKQVGDVVRADIIEDYDGKSKGCGLVEFATEEAAARAIAELNDTVILDRPIFVREDREGSSGGLNSHRNNNRRFNNHDATTRNGNSSGNKGRYRDHGPPTSSGYNRNYVRSGSGSPGPNASGEGIEVIVTNLQWKTSWQNLKDLLKTCGPISRVDIMTHEDGRSKGVAKVIFANSIAARKAVNTFNDYVFGGRRIGVRFAN